MNFNEKFDLQCKQGKNTTNVTNIQFVKNTKDYTNLRTIKHKMK